MLLKPQKINAVITTSSCMLSFVVFTFVLIRSNRLKKSSPEDAVLPAQIRPEIISLISLTAQGAVYPVRPRSRVDQAPFLSLKCDISLIDNLCGKSHCVPKLTLRTVITIYGLKRAGRWAARSAGWRKMHRRLRRHPQGAGTEWNRRRVGVGAADYVSHYFRLSGLICSYFFTSSKNFVWSKCGTL